MDDEPTRESTLATKPPLTPLKRWIAQRQYTQETAANIFDICRSHLCEIANGTATPSPGLARKIQGVTGLSLDHIYGPWPDPSDEVSEIGAGSQEENGGEGESHAGEC